MVFRVPQDHHGMGIVCPGCRRLLRVPGEEDEPPPLMAPLRRVESADVREEPNSLNRQPQPAEANSSVVVGHDAAMGGIRRRRRRKSRKDTGPSWEQGEHGRAAGESFEESRRLGWWLGGGGVALVAIVVALVFWLRREPANVPAPSAGAAAPVRRTPSEPTGLSDLELIRQAEPLARNFLSAKSVEECLPLVREPARAEARMRRFYPDGVISPVGLGEFLPEEVMEREGPIATIQLRDGKFEPRMISFVETPQGLKIDWEAWVGWGPLGWKEFSQQRSKQPTLFRVILEAVDYYNFDFADENHWACYRLSSWDGEHVLYGYVERGSALDGKLKPAPEVGRVQATVMLRFPDQPSTANQVLIDNWLGNCWSIPSEPTP